MSALALVTLLSLGQIGAAPPLPEAPAVELWASEDWPAERLGEIASIPNARLGVLTRSNMLRPDTARVVARHRGALVRVAPAFAEAHVAQFRKLGRATLVIALPERPPPELRPRLAQLGPQTLRFLVDHLDETRAAWLAGFGNAEVELDLRGRVPEQEELVLLRGLTRARRVVRVREDDPSAVAQGLKPLHLSRVVVEAPTGKVPDALASALVELGVPVRVALQAGRGAVPLRRLGHLPNLSLELVLDGDGEGAAARVGQLLATGVDAR